LLAKGREVVMASTATVAVGFADATVPDIMVLGMT
jgi:hypothetical protein